MPPTAKIMREIAAFRAARVAGDVGVAWAALERVHILSQPFAWLHLRAHLMMLQFALELEDWGEARGQLLRLVLAPLGNVSGRLPAGNTGRSNVSAFTPMTIPADLRVEDTGESRLSMH